MSTLAISLPDPLKAYVDSQVTQRGYADASDYMRELVESDRRRKLRDELEQELVQAARSGSEEMTDQDWEDIRREGVRQRGFA